MLRDIITSETYEPTQRCRYTGIWRVRADRFTAFAWGTCLAGKGTNGSRSPTTFRDVTPVAPCNAANLRHDWFCVFPMRQVFREDGYSAIGNFGAGKFRIHDEISYGCQLCQSLVIADSGEFTVRRIDPSVGSCERGTRRTPPRNRRGMSEGGIRGE